MRLIKSSELPPKLRDLIEQRKETWKNIGMSCPMPPSVNHAYVTGAHGRRFLSKEGKQYKEAVEFNAAEAASGRAAPTWVTLTIELRVALHYKNGKIRKFDASNRIELLEDAVCAGLGIDDSRVRLLIVEKIDSEVESVAVMVEPWRADA